MTSINRTLMASRFWRRCTRNGGILSLTLSPCFLPTRCLSAAAERHQKNYANYSGGLPYLTQVEALSKTF